MIEIKERIRCITAELTMAKNINLKHAQMKKIFLSLLAALCLAACNQVKKSDSPMPAAPFFGEITQVTEPVIFAPGYVSTGLEELVLTFTPDGRECYWSIMFAGFETILSSRLENGRWTEPEVAPFAGKYYDGWPSIQPDGKRMFFHSSRPVTDSTSGITSRFNIWYMDRTENGWSEPKILGAPVNGTETTTCPSVAKNGTIYVSKRFSNDTEKLCRAEYIDGAYTKLEVLPDNVNTLKNNFHGSISPDESYLVRPLYGRADNIGDGWNYYVSFRSKDGKWSDLINLGQKVNSLICSGATSFSTDGKFLFFQARAPFKLTYELDRKYSLKEMLDVELRSPGKGSSDIYRIDAKIIEELRPKEK